MPDFESIDLSRQHAYLELLQCMPDPASDYSFINLWGWMEDYDLSWRWDEGLVWIRQSRPKACYWAPVGSWVDRDWAALLARPEFKGERFIRIPRYLADYWRNALPDEIDVSEAPEHFDYLYSVPELIELKGNRFHRKKNLLNQFRKRYVAQYEPITSDMVPKVLAMQDAWCTWQDCQSVEALAAENQAIYRVLQSWSELEGIMGGVITIDGSISAFTVAEAYLKQTLIVHFEKGLPDIIGIYQAINQLFLEQHPARALVNREQDLGDEGLRQAKRSYNPVGFVDKYSVTIR